MRILIANDTFYPDLNGNSYFTYRLASGLIKRGHEVLVIAPSRTFRHEKSIRQGVPVFGLRSIPIPHYANLRIALPFFVKKTLTNVISEFNPEAVHVQDHSTVGRATIKIAKKLGIKIIGTNHFMPENLVFYLHFPDWLEKKVINLAWNDFRRIYEKLDIITTPTKTAVNLLKKYGFSKEVIPISNGIDTKKFRPGQDAAYLKQRYNLPDKPILLYVGRLDKEKNVDLVLRALAQVTPEEIAPHFLIAGKGYEMKNLKKLAEKLKIQNRVTFAGFMPDEDLPFLYNLASVFINAGVAELQSLVMMEAMASGLPVIGVNAMALPELVHDNENGYLFPIGDAKKLSGCIQKMFSNPEQMKLMGEKSLEIIRDHDAENIMSRFESLYNELAKKQ
jgi:1,2-diacylglycerol 3-alpha-glucosyltransferase